MEEEEIDFKVEAELVIEDIGFTVESISISKKLPSSRKCVYLNVLTKERKSLCVELSVLGFRVVGDKFDENQEDRETKCYETIYALLDSVSPGYVQSFGEALVQKLSLLPSVVSEDTSEMHVESADKTDSS
ncbi:hypothetical protein OS493_038749 [Desmophyllum pertusum]|uniref:GSKIP domain-containing protein n=1 Tax=Desmophyllum pertusum TaxID=174260 RepID=A0A9X0CDG4_9CNID|nr:hypothetical protein OS493_038749 [Desmophyllum pertusum]